MPTIYGTFNRAEDVISIFVKKASNNKKITIHGTGKQQRNFMHSEDVANAINHLLNKNYNNKIISLLSDQTLNILNLAKKIVKIIKSKSKIKKLMKAKDMMILTLIQTEILKKDLS